VRPQTVTERDGTTATIMFKTPRGTQDILPADQSYWGYVRKTAARVASGFGYGRIDTPMFEATGLFQRSVGDETDIVQKEMYSFEDHGGDSLTLRPEGTASVCRAYIEHGMHNLPQPVRQFYVAPMFRYERPQAGRVRQHHQFGVEAIGDASAAVDTEIIELGYRYLSQLGISNFTLRLNSLADPEERKPYLAKLHEYFSRYSGDLPQVDLARLERAPLRLLDSKEQETRQISEDAPRSLDHLGDESRSHWEELIDLLDGLKETYPLFEYETDHRLVRGLDYYNRTVFEFEPQSAGGQGTLVAGGRYDPLVEILGGPPTPAIGFGSGIERVILEIKAQEVPVPQSDELDTVIVSVGLARPAASRLAAELRSQGISTVLAPVRSFKAQMRYANHSGAANALILGEREIETGVVALKSLQSDAPQVEVPLDQIVARLALN
jgi:histidyl-tRNA synthetase